jgi:hypothetical protein
MSWRPIPVTTFRTMHRNWSLTPSMILLAVGLPSQEIRPAKIGCHVA